jgi:hypothetical protein
VRESSVEKKSRRESAARGGLAQPAVIRSRGRSQDPTSTQPAASRPPSQHNGLWQSAEGGGPRWSGGGSFRARDAVQTTPRIYRKDVSAKASLCHARRDSRLSRDATDRVLPGNGWVVDPTNGIRPGPKPTDQKKR